MQQQVNYLLQHPDCQAVCGRFKSVDISYSLEDAKQEQYQTAPVEDPGKSGWMYLKLLEISCFHIITLLVRRQALLQVSFNPDYRRGQDFDFWLQLANKVQIQQLDNLYAFYRQNQSSISHRPHKRNYRADILTAAINTYGLIDQDGRSLSPARLKDIYAQIWFEYGYKVFNAGWYRAATKAYLTGLGFKKTRLPAYKFLLLSYLYTKKDRTPKDALVR